MSPRSYASTRALSSAPLAGPSSSASGAADECDAAGGGAADGGGDATGRDDGKSDRSSSPSCASATTLSIAFSSSRTLPGQWYDTSRSSRLGVSLKGPTAK